MALVAFIVMDEEDLRNTRHPEFSPLCFVVCGFQQSIAEAHHTCAQNVSAHRPNPFTVNCFWPALFFSRSRVHHAFRKSCHVLTRFLRFLFPLGCAVSGHTTHCPKQAVTF